MVSFLAIKDTSENYLQKITLKQTNSSFGEVASSTFMVGKLVSEIVEELSAQSEQMMNFVKLIMLVSGEGSSMLISRHLQMGVRGNLRLFFPAAA